MCTVIFREFDRDTRKSFFQELVRRKKEYANRKRVKSNRRVVGARFRRNCMGRANLDVVL